MLPARLLARARAPVRPLVAVALARHAAPTPARLMHSTSRLPAGRAGSIDVPWFMEEPVPEEAEEEAVDIPPPSILSGLGEGQDHVAQFLLPSQLEELYDVLLAGPASHLVAPLSEPAQGVGAIYSMNQALVPRARSKPRRPPIRFIHTPSLTPDQPIAEWIFIVEVRSATRGAVKRLAEEIGFYLEQTAPPAVALEATAEYLEALDLTPEERLELPPGPAVVTREVQEGIRMLHGANPVVYTVSALSRVFSISERMVERLLEPDVALPPAQQARRQIRLEQFQHVRAAAMPELERSLFDRVEAAFARVLAAGTSPQDGEATVQGYEPASDSLPMKVVVNHSYTLVDRDSGRELRTPTKTQRPVHTVQYEGLVPFTQATAASRSNPGTNRYINFRGPRIAARVDNQRKRGDGNWAMVDAGWCQVHVVTPRARSEYPMERNWEEATVQAVYERDNALAFLRDQPIDQELQIPRDRRKKRPRPPMWAPDASDEEYDKWD